MMKAPTLGGLGLQRAMVRGVEKRGIPNVRTADEMQGP